MPNVYMRACVRLYSILIHVAILYNILTPFFSRATLLSAVDDAREGRQRKGGMSQRFAHLAPHARCYVAGTFRAIVR